MLNNNYYHNVQDSFDKKKGSKQINQKRSPTTIGNKQGDGHEQNEFKTIETDQKNLAELADKRMQNIPTNKTTVKNLLNMSIGKNQLPSVQSHINSVQQVIESQKRSFDFTSKPHHHIINDLQDRGTNEEDKDVIIDLKQNGPNNGSFVDKKEQAKWVLMNSKHVRNKSESKIANQRQSFNLKHNH